MELRFFHPGQVDLDYRCTPELDLSMQYFDFTL